MKKKIKTILISQPKPSTEKSPYFDLAKDMKLIIDFRPFIHVEPIKAKEFRKQKVDISKHTAVILTSRMAVDHYFRMADETRFEVPTSMKRLSKYLFAIMYLCSLEILPTVFIIQLVINSL